MLVVNQEWSGSLANLVSASVYTCWNPMAAGGLKETPIWDRVQKGLNIRATLKWGLNFWTTNKLWYGRADPSHLQEKRYLVDKVDGEPLDYPL